MRLPDPLPNDPAHPGRITQTNLLLSGFKEAHDKVGALMVMLALLLVPLNVRYLLAVVDNVRRLVRLHPELFKPLGQSQQEALDLTVKSNDLVASIKDESLRRDIEKSPRAHKRGNLRYATTRHPLYALLMLEHTHPTGRHFDLLMAAVLAKAISLRSDLTWASYAAYIHPANRDVADCPQPLNSSIESIERAARAVTGAKGIDPLACLESLEAEATVDQVLQCLTSQATRNHYAQEAVTLGRLIRAFLRASAPAPDAATTGGGGGKPGFRHALNYGTLRTGAIESTPTEIPGVTAIEYCPKTIAERAEANDIAPGELMPELPQFLIELGADTALPPTSRNILSRYRTNQVARAQQMLPTSPSALRGERLKATAALLARPDIPTRIALMLRASLATGRPVQALSQIHLTSEASVLSAREDVEYDIVRGTWRVRANLPSLRKTSAPTGARATTTHAELPDLFSSAEVAREAHHAAKGKGERIALHWTPSDHDQALSILREENLTPEFLGRALPVALFQQTGDLATGALISRWLPNGCTTLLHYLTVDRTTIAARYVKAANWLRHKLKLPATEIVEVEPGAVGMHNCPDDETVRILVRELLAKLAQHPVRTREDRIGYVNLLSTYSLLYMTQGLGLRNWVDADPNVRIMPNAFDGLGLAIFSDKRVTDAHTRVVYCPGDLTRHIEGIQSLTERLLGEFPAAGGSEAPGLLPYIEPDGRVRRYHPGDVRKLLGPLFAFEPNALRRRARSAMCQYAGDDAAELGHGFNAWMGHWSYASNPHRPESSGLRNPIYRVVTQVIAPLLAADGWRPVPPRI